MGIDIYAKWKDQKKEEAEAQITGFDIYAGKFGYLREAYHGSPYITKYLVSEAFSSKAEDGEPINAKILRERLPIAIIMSLYRDYKVYGEGKEPEKIEISKGMDGLHKALTKVFALEMKDDTHESFAREVKPEQIESVKKFLATGVKLPDTQQSFVDFVELCERKEAEKGEPCKIYASCQPKYMHRDILRKDQRCSKCGKRLGENDYKNHYCPSRATCRACQKLNDKKLSKIHNKVKKRGKYPHKKEPSQKQKFHYPKLEITI